MRGSPFIKPIEEQTKNWEARLHRIEDTLDEWLTVQSQWLYLEPIFSSADIMAQMPEEGRMFQQVDRTWHEVMGYTKKDTNVLKATDMPNLLEKLKEKFQFVSPVNECNNMFVISVTKIHALRNELPVSFPWSHIHGNISRFNIWRLFKYHSKRLKVFYLPQ